MNIALIGTGAIARYVETALSARGHRLVAVLVRPERLSQNPDLYVSAVQDLPQETELVIDCAGHQALADLGPGLLARGMNVISVSIGALADHQLAARLEKAAQDGRARLYLASGAIGALDALQAAAAGTLKSVTYSGRKPPQGWSGSPAEQILDLGNIQDTQEHFSGTAREAALAYPKNANVAAAVALAGLGFDKTRVRLIADPRIEQNIHEVEAIGDFGQFKFSISGNSLPDNPRSSALAAMSVLAKLDQITKPIVL